MVNFCWGIILERVFENAVLGVEDGVGTLPALLIAHWFIVRYSIKQARLYGTATVSKSLRSVLLKLFDSRS